MTLYQFERVADWDEYEGFIVRAESVSEAKQLVLDHHEEIKEYIQEFTITPIPVEGAPGIIMDAFKAG